MNGSRRPTFWRLVALTGLVWLTAAASGYAQNVRVKIGPATIYERPRTSSDVVMTVPEGTVLEVFQRDGDWYWVVLPPDTNGTRRAGYIPVFLCERVGDKRLAEPGIPGSPTHTNVPAGLRPKPAQEQHVPRVLAGIGAGGQFGSVKFTDVVAFERFHAAGQFRADYRTESAWALDATVGVRLAPQFVLGFGYFSTSPTTTASVVALVPLQNSNEVRVATLANQGVSRSESDFRLDITYLVPISRRVDLAIYAGPSAFYLRQDLISELIINEDIPTGTVTIGGPKTIVRQTKVALGAHVGADLTVMLWRFVGVGFGGRYARAAFDLPSAGTGSIPVDVGGPQLSGGVRLRF